MNRFLDALHLIVRSVVCLLRVLLRRAFRGPTRPSWSWKLQAVVGLQQASYGMIAPLGAGRYHQLIEQVLPPPPLNGVELADDDVLAGTWLVPETISDTVMLYLHGGGYAFGSLKTHGEMISRMAVRARARTFVLDYRRAPDHPFPAALDDACAAYRQLLASGIPPNKVVLAGDSAGGGLVLAMLLKLHLDGEPPPACAVAISPWVDLACDEESFQTNAVSDGVSREACLTCAKAYLGDADVEDPLVSPIHATTEALAALPPLLVQVGDAEVLVDQGVAFAEKAKAAGADVELDLQPDMMHVWHMLADFTPQANVAVDRMADFVSRWA